MSGRTIPAVLARLGSWHDQGGHSDHTQRYPMHGTLTQLTDLANLILIEATVPARSDQPFSLTSTLTPLHAKAFHGMCLEAVETIPVT